MYNISCDLSHWVVALGQCRHAWRAAVGALLRRRPGRRRRVARLLGHASGAGSYRATWHAFFCMRHERCGDGRNKLRLFELRQRYLAITVGHWPLLVSGGAVGLGDLLLDHLDLALESGCQLLLLLHLLLQVLA